MGHHSATAPLLALARRYGFRGASMHNIDRHILETGLAVDYREVVRQTLRIRDGLTRADAAEIDFEVAGEPFRLTLDLAGGEAGTSCGKCSERKPNIENLPDGEVYFVPRSASGTFPLTCDDGTVGALTVVDGRVVGGRLLLGEQAALDHWLDRFRDDPATGVLCELGFGTQLFPYSGRGIQDEKILGTVHIATGRSDHLGGGLGPQSFQRPEHATHDDHLFNPFTSPRVALRQVRLRRQGEVKVLIEDYRPAPYLAGLAEGPAGA
jgi:leucyl aminopeptidase (aminopeptidase T)